MSYELVSVPTIGDGSCMFHSILQAFNRTYIQSSIAEKRKMTRQFRNDLADVLDKKINGELCYDKLSRGSLKSISSHVPEVSLKEMKRSLKSNEWGDYRFLELISNILELDIYVIKEDNIYKLGDKDLYYKHRDSIIIFNDDNVHFETVGAKTENGIKTLFDKNDSIIKQFYDEA